jgi:multiple sugar transport system substrate-binding protein
MKFLPRLPGSRPDHNPQPAFSPAVRSVLVIMLVLLLAACGTRPPVTRPEQSTASPASTTPPAVTPVKAAATRTAPPATPTPQPIRKILVEPEALQGVKVVFWHPWSGELGQAVDRSVAAFNRENEYGLAAESVYQGNYNQLSNQVRSALEEGDPPDLAVAPIYQIATWEEESGAVVDLQPYVEDILWGLSPQEQADFYPVFWDQDQYAGQRLGIPAQRSGQLLVYNSSWAKELGFDQPPGTPQEFEDQACASAQANRFDADPQNDFTGGWAINTSPSAFLPWLFGFGAEIVSPGGEDYRFNSPQAEEALVFLKALYDAGCAWEPPGDYAGTEFAGRKALFITSSLTDLPYLARDLEQAGNQDKWTVLPFPSPRRQPAIDVYGPSFALFEGTPEEQLGAWLLAKWLSSPEQQASLVAAGGSFPTSTGTLAQLDDYAAGHPQWSAAQSLLEVAHTEPAFPSWETVRWVVSDVATQVFRYYFTADRIPATLKLMDETAAELHARTGD